MPRKRWPVLLEIFGIDASALDERDEDFSISVLNELTSLKADKPVEGNHLLGFWKFGEVRILIDDYFKPGEEPEIAWEVEKLFESAIERFFYVSGELPAYRYKISLQTQRVKLGSLWIELGIFISAVSVPIWMFLKDYEKLKDGSKAFFKDTGSLIRKFRIGSNRLSGNRIEPVLLVLAKDAKDVLDKNEIFEVNWESDRRKEFPE